MDVLPGFGIAIGLVVAYLLPSFIAAARKLPSSGSVFVLNMLLGWTIIGWITALVLAFGSKPRRGRYAPGTYAPGQWPR